MDMRDILQQILQRYGTSVLEEPSRFASILNDLRMGEGKREASLLLLALREGVPRRLLSAGQTEPAAVLLQRLIRQLVDDAGLAEDASHWAVVSWALALGLDVSPVVTPAVASTPSAPVPTPGPLESGVPHRAVGGGPPKAPQAPPSKAPPTEASRPASAPAAPVQASAAASSDPWRRRDVWAIVWLLALIPAIFVVGSWLAPRGASPDQEEEAHTSSATQSVPTSPPGAPSVGSWAVREGSGIGHMITNPIDGAELIWVPAGEFTMGSDIGAADEKSAHAVYLRGYWMYKTEVTVAQYRKYCEATGVAMPEAPRWGWQDDHPVVNVSWDDAVAYCSWAGVALPTEAQWEKAARGTDGREYPWGNQWATANCVSSVGGSAGSTRPVGSRPLGVSPYGCLDMTGNALEWCADWYAEITYATATVRDPVGPPQGDSRVLRGGSWLLGNPGRFRCAGRYRSVPGYRSSRCGFRCASTF